MKMKFGDMQAGQKFSDGRRNYIKLQTILPSGYRQIHQRLVNQAPDGTILESPTGLEFNSVDADGIPANCPARVEFTIIKTL